MTMHLYTCVCTGVNECNMYIIGYVLKFNTQSYFITRTCTCMAFAFVIMYYQTI